MCEKTVVLTFFFLLKIVILLVIPVFFFINKKLSYKRLNVLFYIEIALITVLIVLRLTNNSCIINSTINGIKTNMNKTSDEYINESNDPNDINSIVTNKIYKSNTSKNVYYFSNNELPLSNKKISCSSNKEVYLKNYGNSLTSISILLSSYFDRNIDPLEILNYYLSKTEFDCDNGINFNSLINLISDRYNIGFYQIDKGNLYDYVSKGRIVLAEVKNVLGANNITCDTGYIIIYNVDMDNKYHVLYSNDSSRDYICSDNSIGALSIIEKNINSKEWDIGSLNIISTRYMILGEK